MNYFLAYALVAGLICLVIHADHINKGGQKYTPAHFVMACLLTGWAQLPISILDKLAE